MPEEVSVNKELGIIEIKSYGIVTREDLSCVLEPVEALVKETGINKVLVDTLEEKELPNMWDLNGFGASIPVSLKVAIVFTEEQPTARKAEFVKNISSFRGVQIQTFTSREDSLEWLNE